VTVDGAPAAGYTWDVRVNQSYLPDYVNTRGGADPVTVELAPGDHIISVYPREDGTRLDTINLELVGP